MTGLKRNVDGSPITDAEDKKTGFLLVLGLLILVPVFIFEKLSEKIRQGRYWRMSDRDYSILQRKMQRKKKIEAESKR